QYLIECAVMKLLFLVSEIASFDVERTCKRERRWQLGFVYISGGRVFVTQFEIIAIARQIYAKGLILTELLKTEHGHASMQSSPNQVGFIENLLTLITIRQCESTKDYKVLDLMHTKTTIIPVSEHYTILLLQLIENLQRTCLKCEAWIAKYMFSRLTSHQQDKVFMTNPAIFYVNE
ncbi:hypothetical protein L9F63_021320, partial [Diploptera punctata]